MKISNPKKLNNKEVIVFDLDGTIAPSKSSMDSEMAKLLTRLLEVKHVAIISGGEFKQFKIQLLGALKGQKINYKNFHLFPTCSSIFYRYQNGKWHEVYAHVLTGVQITKIRNAFKQAYKEIGYKDPKKVYGQVIENRRTQVTFSALGQKVVHFLGKRGVAMKEEWKKKNDVRPKMAKILQKLLPDLEVRIGGATSIDVTKKGVDKAYGVRQINKHLKIPISKMLFVGDAIFPGGNDYAALKSGIDYVAVKDPEETKKLIKKLI
jgi:HAD superfamily hydrolase (TIGR01484 family)